jgi:lysophospholipase L1-like esterase
MEPTEKMDCRGRKPDRASWLRAKTGLLAYLAFLVVLLAGVEGAARVIGARSENASLRMTLRGYGQLARGDLGRFRFVPDVALSYRLKPGFEFRSPDGLRVTRHNDQGFREDDDFPPKSADTLRVICLGGSTTYGVSVVDNAATFPAALERFLNNDLRPDGWAHVEVFNLGVGGYTSREVLMNLRLHGLPLEPDVVLIQCGVNDVAPRFYDDFTMDYKHFRKPVQPLRTGFFARIAYRSHLVLIVGWKLGVFAPITLQSRSQHPMPPAAEAVANLKKNGTEAYTKNLAEAVDLAQDSGARVWLLTQAHFFSPVFQAPQEDTRLLDEAYQSGLIEHNEVIRGLAADKATGLVDLERTMASTLKYFKDPIHMSEAGNLVKARLVAESIRDALPAPGALNVNVPRAGLPPTCVDFD